MMKIRPALLAFASLLAVALPAHAQVIYAVNGNNELLTFDAASPGTVLSRRAITGTGGDDILNIDFRPLGGVLYGLSGNNVLYTIDVLSGVASLVGSTTVTGGFDYGFDFNPAADRIRVVTDAAGNFRLNQTASPITTTADPSLFYQAGDPNQASAPQVAGAAYTNNAANAASTQLFYIDFNLDILALSPSPNTGALMTIGSLNIDVTGLMGFDISGLSNEVGYASLSTDGVFSGLYRIDLATGAATSLGTIGDGSGETILDISAEPLDLSAVPEPSTYALLALGALGLIYLRRRSAQTA